jgi:hypothetical protein
MMPIVPDEEDLPGWVPKNYIEKGKLLSVQELVKIKIWIMMSVVSWVVTNFSRNLLPSSSG